MFLPAWLSAHLIRVTDLLQGRGVWRAYRFLEETQWWEPQRLREYQDGKVRARVAAAAATSQLVAARLAAAGVEPASVVDVAGLARLPVLEREDLRHPDLVARNLRAGEALPNSTGGSTGSNVSFMVDRQCWRWRDAQDLRLWSFLGLGPGARVAVLWGSPMDLHRGARLKERLRRGIDNRRFFSAYRVGRADLDAILDWLARVRPDVLMGYASVLEQAARRAWERGGMPGPTAVISSAEALFPEQRQAMEAAWGTEVFNLYGCREVGLVGLECVEHQGLHVMQERLVVEREGTGEGAQDLLVTDLDNRATPFLRYRIGDLATAGAAGPCACGRGLARLGDVVGRSFDVIRGPDGLAVGGTFWSLLLRTAVAGIETWQVVQQATDCLEIRVTPPGRLDAAGRALLTAKIREALGATVRVNFSEHQRLEPLPSGKHRFVVAAPGARL